MTISTDRAPSHTLFESLQMRVSELWRLLQLHPEKYEAVSRRCDALVRVAEGVAALEMTAREPEPAGWWS